MHRRWSPLLAAIWLIVSAHTSPAQVVLYVNAAATTGANTGSSWADAFQGELGLQNALAAAAPIAAGGTPVQIWIAAGTYKPTADTNIDASFVLLNNVSLLGGFDGDETSVAQRDPSIHRVVLSGELSTTPTVRSKHIVKGNIGTDRTALLDGVTVTSADCTFTSPSADRTGGGALLTGASPTVRSVRFVANLAANGGGAASVAGGEPLFSDCVFTSNYVTARGGGFYCDSGRAELVGCIFEGNRTSFGLGDSGGVLCGAGATVIMTDCQVTANTSEGPGGIGNYGTIYMNGCIVSKNRAGTSYGAMGGTGVTFARECTFAENSVPSTFGYNGGVQGRGVFVDCLFEANKSHLDGVFRGDASTVLLRCVFRRNSGSVSSLQNPLVTTGFAYGCVFSSNQTIRSVIGGAGATLANCVILGNSVGANNGAVGFGAASGVLTNSVVVGNFAGSDFSEQRQAYISSGTPQINHCTIQGWTGLLAPSGLGNNGLNPRFVDPLGPDGVAGTEDDDLRLLPGSPCIDSADADALPPDTYDLDGDGNTTEPLPLDLDGNPRWADDPLMANTGTGFVPYLDRGAYERSPGGSALTSFWNAPTGGVFSASANWLMAVPGPLDEALFELGGAYTVQFDADPVLRRLSLRSGTLVFDMAGRTLTLSDASAGLRLAPATGSPVSLHLTGGTVNANRAQVRTNATLSGASTFSGILENAGTLTPGGSGIGTMTVQGLYQQFITTPAGQTFSGTLALDVGGAGPGQYDQLITPGGYSLLGLLRITALNNFDPPPDLNIRLIDATGASTTTGLFSAALLPSLPAGPNGEFRFYYISYGGLDQGGSVFLNVGTLGGAIGYGAGQNPASVGSQPTAMALGDLNQDQLPDLVLTLPGTPGSVLIFRNLGITGGEWQGWSSPIQIPVGNQPGGVAIGELNGLPGDEIAVSNTGNLNTNPPQSGSVTILVNDGAGNFTAQTPITAGSLGLSGSAPRGIVIANLLGGSGSLSDIAVALSGSLSEALILENSAGLAFTPTPMPMGPRPTSASIADIEGDGDPDLVFSNLGDGSVWVRLNTPTQPYTTGAVLQSGSLPIQVLSTDLTGDNLPEIITLNEGSSSLSVLVNRGGGAFDPAVTLPAGSPPATPRAMTILDMDEDGDLDIAFIAGGEADIKVYRNDLTGGQLGFTLDTPVETSGPPLLLDSTDVTGDTRKDLVPVVNDPGDSLNVSVLPSRFRSSCFTANCDGSTSPPILTANDFVCFLNAFAAGNPLANCDESTSPPVLTANDFVCFVNAFAEGCP